ARPSWETAFSSRTPRHSPSGSCQSEMDLRGQIRRWALGVCCVALVAWCASRKREAPVLAQHAVVAATTWPHYRGTAQQLGVAPGKLASRLKVVWRFRTGGRVTSSPVVANGRVFIGSADGHVYGLRLSDGQKIRSFKTGDEVEASPRLVGSDVVIGSADGNL